MSADEFCLKLPQHLSHQEVQDAIENPNAPLVLIYILSINFLNVQVKNSILYKILIEPLTRLYNFTRLKSNIFPGKLKIT